MRLHFIDYFAWQLSENHKNFNFLNKIHSTRNIDNSLIIFFMGTAEQIQFKKSHQGSVLSISDELIPILRFTCF